MNPLPYLWNAFTRYLDVGDYRKDITMIGVWPQWKTSFVEPIRVYTNWSVATRDYQDLKEALREMARLTKGRVHGEIWYEPNLDRVPQNPPCIIVKRGDSGNANAWCSVQRKEPEAPVSEIIQAVITVRANRFYDVQSTLTHELFHAFGMSYGHSPRPGDIAYALSPNPIKGSRRDQATWDWILRTHYDHAG